MKYPITALLYLVLLAGTSLPGQAQETEDSAHVNIIRTASNLASGNVRDVLTSFFQLAYKDIASDKKEFSFSANLFAIKLKTNPLLNIDTSFVKQRFARNSNIDFSFKLDSNFKFNGMRAGYKYAIVNQRDYAISRSFTSIVLHKTKDYLQAFDKIVTEVTARYPEDEEGNATRLIAEIDRFFNDTTVKFNHLSLEAGKIVEQFLPVKNSKIASHWNPRMDLNSIYQQTIDDFKKKLLWTVGVDASTYKDGFVFADLNFSTEATAGIIPVNDKNNIEFYAKADLSFADDTLKAGRSLNRQVLQSSFGLNWVARNKQDKPVFEFKVAGGYDHIFSGQYINEDLSLFSLEGEMRLRITNELWLPFTLRYQPGTGNVFGFLNVRANFDLLNKLFGTLKKTGWSLPESMQ